MKPDVGPTLSTSSEVRLNINKSSFENEHAKTDSLSWPERIEIVALYSLFLIVFVLGIVGCYRLISPTFNSQFYRKTGQPSEYHELMDQNEKILLEIQRSYQKTEILEKLLQDFMTQTEKDTRKTHEMIANLQAQVHLLSKDLETTKGTDAKSQKFTKNETNSLENLRGRGSGLNKNLNSRGNNTLAASNNPTYSNATSQINVASILIGASVDHDLSSSTDLSSFFGGNQEGYVILERPYLPEGTAWCSYDKEPVLTINLANYKWNGEVPDDAPKEYDVMACLDSGCSHKKMIARNCQYLPTEDQSGPEQKCPLNSNKEVSPIDKIQFIFRKNHGNTERTCVNLVRVYAEDRSAPVVKTEKLMKHLQRVEFENKMTCANLAKMYYDHKKQYPTMIKDCVTVYSKNCCSVCPECCEECLMEDTFGDWLDKNAFKVVFGSIGSITLLVIACVFLICLCDK